MRLSDNRCRSVVILIFCTLILLFVPLYVEGANYNPLSEDEIDKNWILEGENIGIGSSDLYSDIATFSLNTNGATIIRAERIDNFNSNTPPYVTGQLKYIKEDGLTGDSRDKNGNMRNRYVFCLEHYKEGPADQTMTFEGYESPAVHYLIYHGAMFLGETCRNSSYSTGNWKFDYLATQMAMHVVRNQFTLDEIVKSLKLSSASVAIQQNMIHSISTMVSDAKRLAVNNKSGYDSSGWYRMDNLSSHYLHLEKKDDEWVNGNDGYYYSPWISPNFLSVEGYFDNSMITSCEISSNENLLIDYKYDDCVHSPFRFKVEQSTYSSWLYTGKDITTNITITVPRKWKAAVYKPSGGSSYQKVAVSVYENINDSAQYDASITLNIPKTMMNFDLEIEKFNDKNQLIDGAEFSLYKNVDLTDLVNKGIVTNGKIRFENLNTNEEYYLIETKAPTGYPDYETGEIIFIISSLVNENGDLECLINHEIYSANDDDTNKKIFITNDDVTTIHIKVINNIGMKLPETGSAQMVFIILISVICLSLTIRKRRIIE